MDDQHAVWETIAASFDRSRQRRWSHVERFLATIAPASRVLDLMCGNGRHLPAADHLGWIALDWSRPLVATAARRHGVPGIAADATRLPLADACMDACVYVAGLHGLPSADARAASLRELLRVLRPGGRAQITVWSRLAPRFRDQGDPAQPLDVVIPWRSDGHDEDRTYHLYTPEALRADVLDAGFIVTWADHVAAAGDEPDNLVIEVLR